jgi:hypothetical protein
MELLPPPAPPEIVAHIAQEGWGNPKEQAGFRLQTKAVFLTYAGLYPDEATDPYSFWLMLATKIKGSADCDVIVSIEKHKSPADAERADHVHIAVWSKEKTETQNWKHFDLTGRGGRVLHPWIVVPKPGEKDKVKNSTLNFFACWRHNSSYPRPFWCTTY